MECGKPGCKALAFDAKKRTSAGRGNETDYIQAKECSRCQNDRKSRALVAHDANDPRFVNEHFIAARAIFANNDIKYDTNKLRAKAYAAAKDLAVTYCPAKDKPSADALREMPDLPTQKLA